MTTAELTARRERLEKQLPWTKAGSSKRRQVLDELKKVRAELQRLAK